MTEEEAKTKWCPFARETLVETTIGGRATGNGMVGNRYGERVSKCIGSACMAWRWDWDADGMRSNADRKSGATRVGYCGLAGKP